MELIGIVLTLALVGLIVWAVTTYIPMPPIFKTVILIVVLIFLIVWAAQKMGVHLGL